uniref:Claspin n=1 Tax=Glossina pallidipes TaxID=7398 RepID=A0A1A9ZF07_GLOPL
MDELANDTQHQSNEIPGNTSMDEQKMDGKEKSLEEDILGSENLRMSDSDDEFEKITYRKDGPLNTTVSNDVNSPVDRDNENREKLLTKKQEKENIINEINVLKRVHNKKVMRLIDSDTEDEESTIQWGLKNDEMEIQKILPKKALLLVDTDTEEESLKSSQPPNSDDSNSEVSRYNIKNIKKHNKTVKSREQENTEKSDSDDVKQKYSGLIDSDSDSDNRILEFGENHIESEVHIYDNAESKNKKGSKTGTSYKRENVMRASAKKALDEMQAIQSEQQRLQRETHVSIPYHKPKKRTLEEFLKRRTIVKPQLTNVENSPVAALVQAKSLKMTTEELEEYAKLMEERAKEACEFFKSESENESEFVHNSGVLDKLPTMQEQLDKQVEIKSSTKGVADGKAYNTQEILNNEIDILEKPKDNPTTVHRSEEILSEICDENLLGKSPAKVVITEVIELPKLDMNTIHVSPAKLESLVKPATFHNVKELLEKQHLPRNPSLSGDPSKLINLETGDLIEKQPNGVENLMQRLMSTVKVHKAKTLERCNILAFENDKLEVTSVNVNIHGDETSIKKEPKPGAAYFELKKKLKEIIKKKRLEELCKKQEEEKMEYEESSIDTEEEDCGDFENENETDEFSKDEGKEKKEILADIDVTEELEIEKEDQIDEFEERKMDKIQEEETFDLERKNHAANSLADSSGHNDDLEVNRDDIDFLKTQPLSKSPLALRTQTGKEGLLTICSGSFDSTQPTTSALISQIPLVQNNVDHMNEDELLQLCSGRFDGGSETQKLQNEENNSQLSHKSVCNNILSSDEDNDDEEEEPVKLSRGNPRKKKLTKRINKKKAKLGFSDDEEEEEIKEDPGSDLEEEIDATEPEAEAFIDYDSEENEILVHLTKDDRVQEAEKFFENEAELSESDWGSADEDEENDLDKYDIELGDEDEFDKEKLRDELGKIHARKMLDDDIKEVRKFQEMFLEDEENDGVGRQRQFKWRNMENGLTLEDMQRAEIDRDDNGNNSDDPNEHEWRKIRYEREQFLKDKGLKLDSQDASTNLAQPKLPAIVTVSPHCKKLQIINAKKSSAYAETNAKTSSPFLISKGVNLITMNRKAARGSFLVRDKETLNKLAGLNKGKSGTGNVGDIDGGTAAISVNTAKAKNFVFATLTEEEHESLKRKADNLLNSSNENGVNYMKKPKFEPRRDKCFIDQLL